MRRVWWIGAGLLAALALVGAGVLVGRRERAASDALSPAFAARGLALAAQIAQAPAPYAVLVGDSHAERLFLPTLCGAPVVDAGFSGATTGMIAKAIAPFAFPISAKAIVVIAGTNDLARKWGGGTPEGLAAFRAAYEALLARLAPHAGRLLAVPLPPLDTARPDVARVLATDAAPRYDAVIAEACARVGCTLAPAFAAGTAADFAASDGVHPPVAALVRPNGVRERLEKAACGKP